MQRRKGIDDTQELRLRRSRWSSLFEERCSTMLVLDSVDDGVDDNDDDDGDDNNNKWEGRVCM